MLNAQSEPSTNEIWAGGIAGRRGKSVGRRYQRTEDSNLRLVATH